MVIHTLRIALLSLAVMLCVCGCSGDKTSTPVTSDSVTVVKGEYWPPINFPAKWYSDLEYSYSGLYGRFHDTSYSYYLQDYTPFGDYLNYSQCVNFTNGEIIQLDENGIPKVVYKDQVYYNPVTVAQHALGLYGRFINGSIGTRADFLLAVEKLISLQSPDGSFRYPIQFQHKRTTLAPGWVSAMAQGQALSVFARAYHLESDMRFKNAGELAFEFLCKPIESGGTLTTLADLDPSLSTYKFYLEYTTTPNDFTLNGYLFTLLGIYDWSQIESNSQNKARDSFTLGIITLEHLLPYYNIKGYSTYDLDHVILGEQPFVPESYEVRHVYLLHALQSLVSNPVIGYYEKLWTQKIDELNSQTRIINIETIAPSPQTLGSTIIIKLTAAGGDSAPKIFQFYVKYNGVWTLEQPYSGSDTFVWTPIGVGHYDIGLYVKDQNSNRDYDNFRAIPFEITVPTPSSLGL